MKSLFAIIATFLMLFGSLSGNCQEMDQELATLAEKLAGQIKQRGQKKVTVVDFGDLNGATTELGKYVAEQLTVNLVMEKRDFSVLDRANLKKILAEHKLSASGLVDPENAKKLGMFAGVDTIILGTITPKNQKMTLTAKIITTETAEIVGAGRAEFRSDESVQQLVSRPSTEAGTAASEDAKPKVIKTFGDLRVEVTALRIVNGDEYLLSLTLTNQSTKKSVWVAVSTDLATNPKAVISSENGNEFRSSWKGISGVAYAAEQHGGFFQATEIRPKDALSATMRFASHIKKPTAGQCGFNLELLAGTDFDGSFGQCRTHNVSGRFEVQ